MKTIWKKKWLTLSALTGIVDHRKHDTCLKIRHLYILILRHIALIMYTYIEEKPITF